MPAPAIEIHGVTKTFGPKVAVRDLDLVVPTGSVCAFLGPNGAGKTTTIRMVMSILFPDRGDIRVLGRASAIESKDRIGYLPEERGLYRKMRVNAFLTYMARIKGVSHVGLLDTIAKWLDKVALGDVGRKRCEELSKGMQQKVQFIATVIHQPDLIILDEPFSGLDPLNARLLRELIDEQHKAGRTIIFSTHVMEHAEQLCDHVFMIHRGLKVLDSTMQQIRSKFDPHAVIVEPMDDNIDPFRDGMDGVISCEHVGAGFELRVDERVDIHQAMRTLCGIGPVRRIEVKRATLEDVFVSLVKEEPDAAQLNGEPAGTFGGVGAGRTAR